MYFGNLGVQKTWLDKSLKSTFTIVFYHFERK